MSSFSFIRTKQIIVKKWNQATEDFFDDAYLDEDDVAMYAEGVRRFDFDAGLGPYPQEKYQAWKVLSNYITEKVIKLLQPPGKTISSAAGASGLDEEKEIIAQLNSFHLKNSHTKSQHKQHQPQHSIPQAEPNTQHAAQPTKSEDLENIPDLEAMPDMEKAPDSENIPTLEKTPSLENAPNPEKTPDLEKVHNLEMFCPQFTHVPRRVTTKGATPQEITLQNLDKSALLGKVLKMRYQEDPTMLLGELQFAFITFFYGHSYEGFRQWKDLMALLTNCEAALNEMPDLFSRFIDVATAQLERVPEDFFIDELSGNNFLKPLFKAFFENIDDPRVDNRLSVKAKQLKTKMEKRFQVGFSIDSFDDEDAPVLVMD